MPPLCQMEPDCYRAALRILRHRFNSTAELRLKLRARNFDKQTIDDTLTRLTEEHWLDDERFAGSFVRIRAGKRVGPRRIARELASVGVTDEVARKALRENEDEERIRTDAIALCQKKMRTLVRRHGPDFIRTNEGRNKLTAYLLNQGYDRGIAYDVIRDCLERAAGGEQRAGN
jgi:regulatory protein